MAERSYGTRIVLQVSVRAEDEAEARRALREDLIEAIDRVSHDATSDVRVIDRHVGFFCEE